MQKSCFLTEIWSNNEIQYGGRCRLKSSCDFGDVTSARVVFYCTSSNLKQIGQFSAELLRFFVFQYGVHLPSCINHFIYFIHIMQWNKTEEHKTLGMKKDNKVWMTWIGFLHMYFRDSVFCLFTTFCGIILFPGQNMAKINKPNMAADAVSNLLPVVIFTWHLPGWSSTANVQILCKSDNIPPNYNVLLFSNNYGVHPPS